MKNHNLGQMGERKAANYLRSKGYEILQNNYRSRFGEIDIIAKDKTYLVFIEVKLRSQTSLYSGEEAVNWKKQEKLKKTAQFYYMEQQEALQPRFDVIAIVTDEEHAVISLEHYENAFEG